MVLRFHQTRFVQRNLIGQVVQYRFSRTRLFDDLSRCNLTRMMARPWANFLQNVVQQLVYLDDVVSHRVAVALMLLCAHRFYRIQQRVRFPVDLRKTEAVLIIEVQFQAVIVRFLCQATR